MTLPDGEQHGRLAALRAPLYRRFWLGSLASVGAVQLVIMGQSWLVFELSAAPMDLAILGAASSVPTIIMTLAGGVIADRFDRRCVLLVTTPLAAALLATLTMLDASDTVAVWHVWLIAALFATVSGFDWPARQAIFTAPIERPQMMSAIALNSVLWQGTRMIVPAFGGIIVAAFTTAAVFALSTVGFLIMLLVLIGLRVRTPGTPGGRSMQRFMEGLGFVARTRLFAVIIPFTFVYMFFGTSYLQIMPLFADRLGSGSEGYGVLISASGLGSILGTLAVGAVQQHRRLGRIMLGAALAGAIAQLGFAALTEWAAHHAWSFAAAAVLVALVAAMSSGFLVISMTTLQLNVPDALRGRVMSLHGITFSMIALGALFSGGLATFIGAPGAVACGAGIIVISALAVWRTQPAVRMLSTSGTGISLSRADR